MALTQIPNNKTRGTVMKNKDEIEILEVSIRDADLKFLEKKEAELRQRIDDLIMELTILIMQKNTLLNTKYGQV